MYEAGVYSAAEICKMYGVSERTLRRWKSSHKRSGLAGLKPKRPGPKKAKHAIKKHIEQRILALKQRYPSWGARRIKNQFNLPVHWRTVHSVIKKHGMLIRVKAKPQPCRRFQRKHVDSLWQGDTFQFRVQDVGKVYITGFTDDCSRYRVRSKAYLRKGKEEAMNALRWALRKGRLPKQIYLDNGRQFTAREFKEEAAKHGIKLVFGRPHHPRGRGKIESYHRVLHRELITLKRFGSLSHFRRELWKFDRKYNVWRKQEALGWRTPASVYSDERHFNRGEQVLKKRT